MRPRRVSECKEKKQGDFPRRAQPPPKRAAMAMPSLALLLPFSMLGIVAIGAVLLATVTRQRPYRSRAPQLPAPLPPPKSRRRRRYVRVLIIDTTNPQNLNDPLGSDCRNLQALFAHLNETTNGDVEYDVRVEENLTGDAVLNTIKDTDPNDICMFACFILARGSVAEVIGADGERCSTRELTCALTGTMWEAIPKVFCVQALQDGRSETCRRSLVVEELVRNTFFFLCTATTGDCFIDNLCNVIRRRAPIGWPLPVIFTEAMGSGTSHQAPYFISTLSRECTFPAGKPCTGQHGLDCYTLQKARVLVLKVDTSHGLTRPSVAGEAIDYDISLLRNWLGSRRGYTVEVRTAEESSASKALNVDGESVLICFVLWNCTRLDRGRPNWGQIRLKEIMARFASNATGKPKFLVFQAYGSDFNSDGQWAPQFPVGADTLFVTGSLKVSSGRAGGGIVEHLMSTAENGLWVLRDAHELRRKVNNDASCDAVFVSTLTKELVLAR